MRKSVVLSLVIALSAPLAWAEPSQPSAPCPGYTYLDGIGRACPQGDGTYMVMSPDGRELGTVSHTDPIPPGPEPVTMLTSASQVECVDSSAQYAIIVIYARASNDGDAYSTRVSTIRTLVAQAQQHISDAAAAGGGTSKLKVLCDGDGQVTVKNEVLPTTLSGDNFDTIVNDLRNKGYNDPKKKYWVWYDDSGACSCAGTGHWYSDSSDSVNNYNNGNHPQPFFAVTFSHNSVRTWLHELGHTLGAVQNNAPGFSGTNYGHCVDGKDILCYNDGGQNTGSCVDFYCSGTCSVEVWDCQRNTYYNLAPSPGSWLDTKWNIGETYVRYLTNVRNIAPTMTSLNCAPTTLTLGQAVSCDFTATDNADQVAYNVDWGDGTTERVPASGFVPSGTTRTASRTYGTDGVFTVRVSATDNNASSLTSSALTRTVSVQAPPVMELASCAPSPTQPQVNVTCSFRARDNSTGVFYTVNWGDGTPTTRVPATAYVAPGQTRTATHAWASTGPYTVSVQATDNGTPQLSSGTLTTSVTVDANAPPTMTSLSCSPNPVQAENALTCSFRADDVFTGLYYTLDWGDGSAPQRVPASGTVQPGTTQTASRTFMTAGARTISVTATDTGSPPLTSSALSTDVNVTPPNLAPVMVSASCNLVGAGIPTTCVFRATDADSSGVRYRVEWGDSSVTTAPSGYATPGQNFTLQHVYHSAGAFLLNVTATDNGSPARTSASLQIIVNVSADGAPPVLTIQDPFPKTLYYGCMLQRDIRAGDAVFVQRGCVRATAFDASGVANVTVLLDGVRVAVDTTAPYELDFPLTGYVGQAVLSVIAYDNVGNSRRADQNVMLV